jgi:hypothetical protein
MDVSLDNYETLDSTPVIYLKGTIQF